MYEVDDRYIALENEDDEENHENSSQNCLDVREQQIVNHRSGSQKFQRIQAEKMKEASRKRFILSLNFFLILVLFVYYY